MNCERSTLISPPQHHRPGNPSSAPAYGSSGSAPLPAACASWFFLSLGGKGSRKIKNKKTDKVINTYITGWLGHSDLKPSCITREQRTFGHLQLTRANWPYSKVSWLLNTESRPKQSLNFPPLMYNLWQIRRWLNYVNATELCFMEFASTRSDSHERNILSAAKVTATAGI